jgi:ribonuclease BN (tRNA processing enzyme)
VEHSPQSIAFRITGPGGRRLVYSGDTDYSESLVDLARGADLLICESSFPEEHKVRGHLTPAMAGDIAARAAVRRLMLTHFYPACDRADIEGECRRTYRGPLVLARDLMRLSLG